MSTHVVEMLHGPVDGEAMKTSTDNNYIYVKPNWETAITVRHDWWHAYHRCTDSQFLYVGYAFENE